MRKIKWEYILLFILELLTNAASVGASILLNALIDAAEISVFVESFNFDIHINILLGKREIKRNFDKRA